MLLVRQKSEYLINDGILYHAFLLEQGNQNVEQSLLFLRGHVDRQIAVNQSSQSQQTGCYNLFDALVNQLLLDKLHVLERRDLLVDCQNPEIAPDSASSQCVLHMVQVILEPLYRGRVVANLAVGVFVVIHVDSPENKVSRQLANVNFIVGIAV